MSYQKYFDSGDYNVAKSQGLKLVVTPQKPSNPVKQNLTVNIGMPVAHEVKFKSVRPTCSVISVAPEGDSDGSVSPTGLEIPRPETIPSRKTSLIQPEVGSKLSPLPHLFHSPQPQQLTALTDDWRIDSVAELS